MRSWCWEPLGSHLVLTWIVGILHVSAGLMLIMLVLMHSGKGGGLSDMFGGVGSAAAGSTVIEKNLDRITVIVALVFGFTTIAFAQLLSA